MMHDEFSCGVARNPDHSASSISMYIYKDIVLRRFLHGHLHVALTTSHLICKDKKAVTSYLKRKQLLPFGLAR